MRGDGSGTSDPEVGVPILGVDDSIIGRYYYPPRFIRTFSFFRLEETSYLPQRHCGEGTNVQWRLFGEEFAVGACKCFESCERNFVPQELAAWKASGLLIGYVPLIYPQDGAISAKRLIVRYFDQGTATARLLACHFQFSKWLIFLRIARALQAFHAKGFVHCDLKLDNVMMDRAGNVYLIDFNFAEETGTDIRLFDGTDYAHHWAPELLGETNKTDRTYFFRDSDTHKLYFLFHHLHAEEDEEKTFYRSIEETVKINPVQDIYSFCYALAQAIFSPSIEPPMRIVCIKKVTYKESQKTPEFGYAGMALEEGDEEFKNLIQQGLRANPEKRLKNLNGLIEKLQAKADAWFRLEFAGRLQSWELFYRELERPFKEIFDDFSDERKAFLQEIVYQLDIHENHQFYILPFLMRCTDEALQNPVCVDIAETLEDYYKKLSRHQHIDSSVIQEIFKFLETGKEINITAEMLNTWQADLKLETESKSAGAEKMRSDGSTPSLSSVSME